MQDGFDYTIVSSEMVKSPEVFVFDTCPITIKQIEEWVWQENKGRSADMKQERGKPVDKNDHQPENLRRLLQANFYFEPEDDRGYTERDTNPDPYYQE